MILGGACLYKAKEIIWFEHGFWVEYLMRARSGLDLNKANLLMDRDLFGACSDLSGLLLKS